jgi:MFS family permease
LTGNTSSLLASGVGGILLMLATIPAVLYIDQLGRKPVLIAGALGMGISHLIVAGLYGHYGPTGWSGNSGKVAGWVAVVFVWIYEINFGYSWGVSHNLSKLTLTLLDILLTIFPAWRMGPRR